MRANLLPENPMLCSQNVLRLQNGFVKGHLFLMISGPIRSWVNELFKYL